MDITDPFFSWMIDGVEKTLNKGDYYFVLTSTHNSLQREEIYLNTLRRTPVDGLMILGGSQAFGEKEIDQLIATGVPIVVVGRQSPSQSIGSVAINNRHSAFGATDHLISLGHSKILFLDAGDNRADSQERTKGYLEAMTAHGLQQSARVKPCGITAKRGYDTTAGLLRTPDRPTALFTYNDWVAFGAIKAIQDCGYSIPEDLAVVGFDDVPMATFSIPSLTTIRQPRSKMGEIGAELLLRAMQRMQKNVPANHIVVKTELIVRESTTGKQGQNQNCSTPRR